MKPNSCSVGLSLDSDVINKSPLVSCDFVSGGMAPSPDNDSAPKAPDKVRQDKGVADKNKEVKTLSDLNDGELRGLLDEALNYKNPKDREGKSQLFNNLLNEAEEDERNARAARAGGSQLVRYCNPSAKRSSRHRKKPSSISENMMHGGSLDNLAKEELYETSKHRTKKSVSARQREGGSLPCNVNSSTTLSLEYQFLEEARKKKVMTEKISTDVVEEQRLLEHDTLDQNFQEKINDLPQLKYTTRASLQVNVSEQYGEIDRNRIVEKKGLQPRIPIFHVFMSRGGPDNDVDGPLHLTHLEQGIEKKSSVTTKSIAPIIGADCSGTIRIANDSKKVDENGNALHHTLSKTKKKKILSDKNVVVCNAENVAGHRSDIISDIKKLMEFIGTSDDQAEKPRLKSKLNRNSSDDSKSKKRTHSSKTKDNRSKLKKSNSLGEISTTNLDDFAFDNDSSVVLRNKNNEKIRERRSWGNMEPLPLQNLYTSVENLESAEFRVVTKKKKSKKRRNSISGRTKNCSNPNRDDVSRVISPDARRKSVCSVPHSEKSNDSSDVDSVHSLPIDAQGGRHNMPLSYAQMAKNKERKNATTNQLVNDYLQIHNSGGDESGVKSLNITPPDVNNDKNFPAIITKQGNGGGGSSSSVGVVGGDKIKVGTIPLVKVKKEGSCEKVKNKLSISINNEESEISYSSSLPPNIPDVQTIEKMQLMSQGHPSNCYENNNTNVSPTSKNEINNGTDEDSLTTSPPPPSPPSANCDNQIERTRINLSSSSSSSTTTSTNIIVHKTISYNNSNNNINSNNVDNRPPVVILSGFGNSKEVPGLVFGFDINEQLLSEDNNPDFCCDDFISRYVPPDVYSTTSHNHDKIVSYIGSAWEEALVNLSSGKVQYYTDIL